MDGGSRSLYTKKPVRKPADLKGQKIRMMGNPLFVDTMNAMGGNGIAMGYGEVFSALQTGVVDGAENNPPTLLHRRTTIRSAPSTTRQTNHLIIPEIFVLSKVTWDKLSPADQALVKKLCARGAVGAAQALGRERGRLRPPSSRPRASSSSRSTTSRSTTPPRRCAPSTAPSTPT